MKVAFPTNDRKTLFKHTGRAKEFAVYELASDSVINIEYINNDHANHDHKHGEGHSHKELIEKLGDIDYLYVNHLGKHFKADMDEAELRYEIIDETEIKSIVRDFFDEDTE